MTPKLPYELGSELREQLNTIVPENANKPYDMHEVIRGVIDEDSFFVPDVGGFDDSLIGCKKFNQSGAFYPIL